MSTQNSPLNFQTPGYEHLELSTQIVIAEALKRNLKVEVIDPSEQFIRITGKVSDKTGTHSSSTKLKTEYIREATRTSLDSYITSLILENKWVQKKIMDEAGVSVPQAFYCQNAEEALRLYDRLSTGAWVVKPKSTNFGIGITIFEEAPQPEAYEKAIQRAAQHGPLLIEEFLQGPEYRFLVLGNECAAVLNRIPANIIGDGKQNIQELVKEKNADPRRGTGYKTPLEFIKIEEVEKEILAAQNLTPQSVPEKDQQIFLRKNSNISTGGDSIDVTDSAHPKLKEAAVKAAQAVGAQICGVDIITPNLETGEQYGIIELNFNPVLYFHDFPYQGKNRHTGVKLLNLLGF
jgi:D-alanine-D-alanine ligase-like ATP-grasp enzyme